MHGKQSVHRGLLRRHHRQMEPLIESALYRMAKPGVTLVGVIKGVLHELVGSELVLLDHVQQAGGGASLAVT